VVNIKVNEFKIQIDGSECTFRLDFNALIKFNERYDDAMADFNNFLQGKELYNCIVKILSCACVEKEFTEEELKHSLSFDFKTMKLMDEITFALVEGILSDKKDEPKGKN